MIALFLLPIALILRIISNPLGNVFQKQLTFKHHHPLLVNFLTYFLLALACAVLLIFIPWPGLSQEFWFYSGLGGVFGALGNSFLVKALQRGELSVLGPINSYKSVVGMISAILLLGETPNLCGLLGIFLIIYGSYWVLDTTEERFSFALLKRKDIQFRLWAMILTAIEAVLVKKVILSSSLTFAFISWCVFGAFFSFLLLRIYELDIKKELGNILDTDMSQYVYLVLCIGIMQLATNYVLKHMEVGYALSLFQLSTIVSVLLGHRIFKELEIRKKLVGSLIMILGSVLIILLKDG